MMQSQQNQPGGYSCLLLTSCSIHRLTHPSSPWFDMGGSMVWDGEAGWQGLISSLKLDISPWRHDAGTIDRHSSILHSITQLLT